METLEEMLKRHEGWKLSPYSCPSGHKTIGAGHNIDAKGLPDDIKAYLDKYGSITEDMAERLLEADIADARGSCRLLFPAFDSFTIARQNALIDMAFNLGGAGLQGFHKAVTAVNKGDWTEAAAQFKESSWYVQVKGRAVEDCTAIKEG